MGSLCQPINHKENFTYKKSVAMMVGNNDSHCQVYGNIESSIVRKNQLNLLLKISIIDQLIIETIARWKAIFQKLFDDDRQQEIVE